MEIIGLRKPEGAKGQNDLIKMGVMFNGRSRGMGRKEDSV
jgi:hypothetical protein